MTSTKKVIRMWNLRLHTPSTFILERPESFVLRDILAVVNGGGFVYVTDEMRRPVSGRDAVYAPKLSTCSKAQEIKETGNEEG